MTKVAIWPADYGTACSAYRLRFPALALQSQGADVTIDMTGPVLLWSHPWEDRPGPDHRILGLAKPYEADVVVLQRPSRRWWADMIPFLHKQGTRVVIDMDDLLAAIPRTNAAWGDYLGDVVHHRSADEVCKLADVVTVTTPALLDRYGHGHGVVLPNLVPASYLDVFGMKLEKTVGWSGFVETHPGDLRAPGGAISQALEVTGWGFHVIGSGAGVRSDLRLAQEPSVTGPVAFAEYPYELARLELGIVPLAPSPFNSAKSSLKASEMAALGVPVVMSPTPDNLRLHALGVGEIAHSRSEWSRRLQRLIRDESARTDLAEKGRAVMATQTYEIHADQWHQAWIA